MSAPESGERESRIVFDAGPERLVLMAQEDFAFAGDNFEKDVREWLAGCKAIAHRILLSVAPGKKILPLGAGERRLFADSKRQEIAITVPKNTIATRQDGPDFLVHRLTVLGRLGADSGSIGIYIGNHPSFNPRAKKAEGTMFGKKVEWHSLQQGRGLEALCDLSMPDDIPLFAHVWVQAPSDAQIEALRQAA